MPSAMSRPRIPWRPAVATALLAMVAAPALAGPVYLPLGNADRLAVVDHASGEVRRILADLPAPHGAALTPDGTTLVVGSFAEREADTMPPRPAGVDPAAHARHHAKKPADDAGVTTISLLDPATGEVRRRVDLAGAVHHVAVDPSGRWAAFTHPGYGRASVVDLAGGEAVLRIPTGEGPNYLVFSPDGRRLYVGNSGDDTVTVLRVGTWTVAGRFRLPVAPGHMALSPDGGRLYVADAAGGTVLAVATEDGAVLARRDLGEALHGLALAPDGGTVFVAVTGGDRLVALDAADLTVREERRFAAPYHVTVVTDGGRLMVSSAAEPVLHVWDLGDLDHVAAVRLDGIGHQAAHL